MSDKEALEVLIDALMIIRRVYSPNSVAYREADEALKKVLK